MMVDRLMDKHYRNNISADGGTGGGRSLLPHYPDTAYVEFVGAGYSVH